MTKEIIVSSLHKSAINGRTSFELLHDGYVVLLPFNKSTKIPWPIAFVPLLPFDLKCPDMFMARTIVLVKSTSTHYYLRCEKQIIYCKFV
jgi:hypothetical protein